MESQITNTYIAIVKREPIQKTPIKYTKTASYIKVLNVSKPQMYNLIMEKSMKRHCKYADINFWVNFWTQ